MGGGVSQAEPGLLPPVPTLPLLSLALGGSGVWGSESITCTCSTCPRSLWGGGKVMVILGTHRGMERERETQRGCVIQRSRHTERNLHQLTETGKVGERETVSDTERQRVPRQRN